MLKIIEHVEKIPVWNREQCSWARKPFFVSIEILCSSSPTIIIIIIITTRNNFPEKVWSTYPTPLQAILLSQED